MKFNYIDYDGNESKDENEDKVGYKKPPKKTRFKKGVSGNPKGRPKKSSKIRFEEDYVRTILKIANEPVSIRVNGEVENIPILEAVIKITARKAAKGNARATQMLLSLLEKSTKQSKEIYIERLETLTHMAGMIDDCDLDHSFFKDKTKVEYKIQFFSMLKELTESEYGF